MYHFLMNMCVVVVLSINFFFEFSDSEIVEVGEAPA